MAEQQLADLRANAEHLRESLHVQDNQVDFEVASNQLHTVYEIIDAFNAKSGSDANSGSSNEESGSDADSKTKPVLHVEPDRFLENKSDANSIEQYQRGKVYRQGKQVLWKNDVYVRTYYFPSMETMDPDRSNGWEKQ